MTLLALIIVVAVVSAWVVILLRPWQYRPVARPGPLRGPLAPPDAPPPDYRTLTVPRAATAARPPWQPIPAPPPSPALELERANPVRRELEPPALGAFPDDTAAGWITGACVPPADGYSTGTMRITDIAQACDVADFMHRQNTETAQWLQAHRIGMNLWIR